MPHTEIIYLLDRSGSMSSLRQAAITGFNDFLTEQAAIAAEARLTLMLFNEQHHYVHDAVPLAQVSKLTELTYQPGGNTALLDALGQAITQTRQRLSLLPPEQRPHRVAFAIFTDGQENASTRYTREHIADLVRLHREHDKWDFLFLAANLDAFATGEAISMAQNSSSNVVASPDGLLAAQKGLSRKIASYRKESAGETLSAQENHALHCDLSFLVEEENQKASPPQPPA